MSSTTRDAEQDTQVQTQAGVSPSSPTARNTSMPREETPAVSGEETPVRTGVSAPPRDSEALNTTEDDEELPLSATSSGALNMTSTMPPVPETSDHAPSPDSVPDATSGQPLPASTASPDNAAPEATPDAATPANLAEGGNSGGGEPPAVTHAQDAGQPAPPPNEEPMTLIDHLNELRRRLMRVVIVVILGFVACYGISEPIYAWLSEPLKAAMPAGSKLIYTSPQGAFFVYMKVALVASIFLTSPFSFYQIWSFIAPGLYKEEKRAVMPLAFFSAFFFLTGASFCYYLVFPIAFQFFMGFATDAIIPMISVEEYLSFALKLLIAFGLVFEMPLFAYFLAKLGVLTPEMMRRQRKYAILAIFIVAAILTPPDVFSQCLMAAPMLFLYEVSIYVARSAYKPKPDKSKAQTSAEEGAPHGDA